MRRSHIRRGAMRRHLAAWGLALALAGCGGAGTAQRQAQHPTPPPCTRPPYQSPPWDQGMNPPAEPTAQGDTPSGCPDTDQ